MRHGEEYISVCRISLDEFTILFRESWGLEEVETGLQWGFAGHLLGGPMA